MHALVVPRGCIPVELQGRERFVNVYLEFMKVVRSLVELTLICEYTQHQEEVEYYIASLLALPLTAASARG